MADDPGGGFLAVPAVDADLEAEVVVLDRRWHHLGNLLRCGRRRARR